MTLLDLIGEETKISATKINNSTPDFTIRKLS
jgi:hypothetical protein